MNNQLQKLFSEGVSYLQSRNFDKALLHFNSALNIAPSNPTILLYKGAALHEKGLYVEAIASYQTAILSGEATGELYNNLGNSLLALGRFADAAKNFSMAVELLPQYPVPITARATALQALGKITEAESDCHKAIQLDNSFAAAHWNLALNLLLQGKYTEGWQEYEWRWKKPDFTSPVRHADVPRWDGCPLDGKTILLHAEQGFGDAIQFSRYAPLVAKRGGNVLIECHPQLISLFNSIKGVTAVYAFGEKLPEFTYQIPLLSLPLIFGTNLENIPTLFPYLSASVDVKQKWSELIPNQTDYMKVGLVWAGKSYPDPLRSCKISEFGKLFSLNIKFYSLQLGANSEELESQPTATPLIDLTNSINSFADTAALIEHLDLVVSIDTAVAHLAGALGKQVFLLLPFAPDWRWLLERSDSPWYPTMKLFRQKQPGKWGEVIDRVYNLLNSTKQKIL